MPSLSSVPKASSSPVAQSMPPSRTDCARFSMACLSFGCTVKPSGMFTNASPMCWSSSAGTAVSVAERVVWSVACAIGGSRPVWPSTSVPASVGSVCPSCPAAASLMASLVSMNTRSSCCW